MNKLQSNGITIAYSEKGSGKPLLLIAGLGYGRWLWRDQLEPFSQSFRVIAPDNRGSGESDRPAGPYSVRTFASDMVGVLDGLEIERADWLGTSLGGMIALQAALDHPARVDRLVLVATTFGGPNIVMPDGEVISFLAGSGARGAERFRKGFELSFSPAYAQAHPETLSWIMDEMSANPQPEEIYRQQAFAPLGFAVEDRLGEIANPVLVVNGEADRVVPPENAKRLAHGLPHGHLALIPGAGHLCFVEAAAQFNRVILDFLGATG